MRFRLAAIATALVPLVASAQTPPADSQRSGRSLRVLELIQGFQMASSPELSEAVNALLADDGVHMHMLPRRPMADGDSARAADIVKAARAALSKYSDVAVAEQNGYVEFMPWLENQSIYHYNNVANVLATLRTFDATKPVSLLYKKDASGKRQLVGAMYSAVPNATPADLDAKLPTSIAHWHEHVDFCGPSPDSVRAGTQKIDAASTARWLKITTREECTAAGGRFVPRLFGWMAHVYLFGGDDPRVIWGEEHGSMDVHVHHPPDRHTR
jgi:hypothetical protein